MLISLNDVARIDFQAAYLDGHAYVGDVHVCVRDEYAGGEREEADFLHLVEVADAAVGNGAYGAERAVQVRLNFAPERADGVGPVQVFEDEDPRRRNLHDLIHPLGSGDVHVAGRGRVGDDLSGNGVSDHVAHIGEDALDLRPHEANVSGLVVERLDSVRYGAGWYLAEGFEKV